MKRFTRLMAIGLTAVCLTGCLTACKVNKTVDPNPGANANSPVNEADVESLADNQTMTGGWTTAESTEVTAAQKKYFKDAITPINGYFFEPVALLGTQVVSGTNYVFLCKSTLDGSNASHAMKYTYIYVNLQGEAKFLGDKDVTLPGFDGEQKSGGWEFAADPTVTEDVKKVVEKASSKVLGAKYEAVAYIGSQVVAGRNHMILVKSTPLTRENAPGSLILITVYEDLQGNCQITETTDVNLNFG